MFSRSTCFLFAWLLIIVSCQNIDTAEKPENLLSKEKMEEVLTDMIILDAIISVNQNKIEEHQIDVTNFIYTKYNIDSLTLAQNISFYNENYEINNAIYDSVKVNIEQLKNQLEVDKKVKDSLQKEMFQQKKSVDTLQAIR